MQVTPHLCVQGSGTRTLRSQVMFTYAIGNTINCIEKDLLCTYGIACIQRIESTILIPSSYYSGPGNEVTAMTKQGGASRQVSLLTQICNLMICHGFHDTT